MALGLELRGGDLRVSVRRVVLLRRLDSIRSSRGEAPVSVAIAGCLCSCVLRVVDKLRENVGGRLRLTNDVAWLVLDLACELHSLEDNSHMYLVHFFF